MTARALHTQAILDGRIRLTSCACTMVTVQTGDGRTLDAEILDGAPEPGMVALNPKTGKALVLDESWLKAVRLWLEAGRVTLHHPHECDGSRGGVRTAGGRG